MRYLKYLLLALAATALLAAGGCGGDDDEGNGEETTAADTAADTGELSKEEYASELKGILEPLGSELQNIGDVVRQSENAQQLSDNVVTAEERIQQSIDELNAITPPAEAESAHQTLITALENFNGALKKLSDAAAAGNNSEILSAATELPQAVQALQTDLSSAQQQLQSAGIDIGNP